MQVVKSKGSSDEVDGGVENIIDETVNDRPHDMSPTYRLKINSIFEKKTHGKAPAS